VNRLLLSATLLIAGHFSVRAGAQPPAEYEVKAAFIYNFAKYIAWPAPDAGRPLVVGVIGKDPFGRVLDDAMRGRTVQNRKIVVRRFTRVDDVANCDILFVASSETRNLPRILSTLRNAPVVTIGDMDQFAERGGMINLTMNRDRVQFEINVDALTRAGLKAGSPLLRLARIVKEPRMESK